MVEEDAVGSVHAIGFAVVHHDPVSVELGGSVGAARVEGGGFLLRDFLNEAVKLRGGRLVEAGLVFHAEDADRLEQAKRAHGVGVRGVLRRLERDLYVALRGEVIDLVWLGLLDDPDEVRRIGHVAIVKDQARVIDMRVLIEMLDTSGVERGRPALHAMDRIALLQQEFDQIRPILSRHASDQRCLVFRCH